ncbi:TPA: DUF3854 domain-containing protein [Clostridium botulinum]|uniref:CHC2 zinc finger domain-containing protein n=1 Tax=Clostridium sporogenes TaxID=1509 RepID=UPI0007735482|nr:CHC2 zinc finger domain-containing protein [Clostridium sporogenes]AUM93799.1 DNA primase [Clostridium sporogenes]HBJ2612708.1 DUF3854 domain-containing protein [Clostridium botulinum]
MNKKQFLEELIEKIKSISLEIIIGTRIQLIRKGMYYMGICPFHNDHKIGSFIVTPSKGIWKCFTCDVGGDAIQFIALYDKVNYVEAAFNIGLEFNLISSVEYEQYFSKRKYKAKEIKNIQKKYMVKINNLESTKANSYTLNKVYEIFTSCCDIYSAHYIHLLTKRQIAPHRINRDYFTFPTRKIWNQFVDKLNKCGYNEKILESIPGFYFDIKRNQYTFAQYKGIGIKIRNTKGEIVGIQIRKDKKRNKQDQRYIWFSSSFANLEENKDKYKLGTGAGSPIDVVYPSQITNNPTLSITEGRFKAEKLAERGVIAISVQGVTTWRKIIEVIEEIKRLQQYKEAINKFHLYCQYKGIKNKKIPIYICFDADMIGNFQVYTQGKKMSDAIEKKFHEYKIIYLQWNEKYGNGIDDLIINNQANKARRFKKETLDYIYGSLISNILKEYHEYEGPNKIPNELIKKKFYTIINQNERIKA